MIGVQEIVKIDRNLIDLQSKPAFWGDNLRSAVSAGFTRRPWDAQTAPQSIDEVVDAINGMPTQKIAVTAEHGWLHGTLGVVSTTCTWPELGADDVQVIRVYTNRSGH